MRVIITFVSLLWITLATVVSASESGASRFVDDIGVKVVSILSDEALSQDKKRAKMEKMFRRTVDTRWIGKFVLGRHWRDLSKEQQKRYLNHYESFLIRHYTANFTEYTEGTSLKINRSVDEGSGEYLLSTEVLRPNQPSVLLDYRVRKNGKNYKVFDIIVEGVSLLATQRSEFASVIERKGIDFLIDTLAKKAVASAG